MREREEEDGRRILERFSFGSRKRPDMIISEARANVVRRARTIRIPRGYEPGSRINGKNQSSSLKSLSRPPGTSLFRGTSFKSPRAARGRCERESHASSIRSAQCAPNGGSARASHERVERFPVKPTGTPARSLRSRPHDNIILRNERANRHGRALGNREESAERDVF